MTYVAGHSISPTSSVFYPGKVATVPADEATIFVPLATALPVHNISATFFETPPMPPLVSKETTTTTATTATTTATTIAATLSSQTPATRPPSQIQETAPTAPYLLQQVNASQPTMVSQKTPGVVALSPPTTFTAWGQSVTDSLKEQAQPYRINIELQTVFEIWDLWTLGVHGNPSVVDLIRKHKMEWLHHTDREIYRDYRSVLLTLERAVRLLKIDVRAGLARLEKIRVDFEMSVREFAKVLTEIDTGKMPIEPILALSSSNQYPETIRDFAAAIAGLTLPQRSMTSKP
jgi:hypothetical protein